ncbi:MULTISPECIES: hypothetical protein [unclassified Bradyrhizobium]|uniref:hypothetical protein n=1 Tax=unclassified Bradyrhizobium TaxID=2631580 RepID=UPI0024798527|nr:MULTISPECIES: hypothetical protein [unclassified Bradyrhizobium]WGS18945.1 hypothetical protein MTX22_31200 [Bradyrhizobium sp. ISRA463]WGS25778.1 hypothetical protein MTX19_28770 [Bradyrhizobium sp. ISRA464]
MTILNTIVAPNLDSIGIPIRSKPIVLGIGCITRTRRNAPPIEIVFVSPRADLLGVELGKWTDEQIAALGEPA